MSDSDLVEIAKRNGEFKRNYGPVLGAILFAWASHLAVRPRPIVRPSWLFALGSAAIGIWKLWPWS